MLAGQQGANGLLVIDPVSGEAEYTTTIDPQVEPAEYAALLASAPSCNGVLDTFEYTLIGLAMVLVNECDQTNTTPASPDNVTAALSTPPTNGTAVVNPDGATIYTPRAGFVGTDTFTYTIVTIDAGQPRTDSATVTVTVAAAPPVVTPPRPELPATGSDNVLPIGLAGTALLLLWFLARHVRPPP